MKKLTLQELPHRLSQAIRERELTLTERGGGFFTVDGSREALVRRVDIDTYEVIEGALRLMHMIEHLDERRSRAS